MDILIIFLVLLGLGYFVGGYLERRHWAAIRLGESQTQGIVMMNVGRRNPPDAQEARLVVGSVVVSSDYFKTFVGGWKQLFGGRIEGFQGLLERARREALLRMKADAQAWGATKIINVRIETAELGGHAGQMLAVEVVAYGTGIR